MSEQILYTGRKSSVAYVLSAAGTLFLVFLFGGPALMTGFNGYPGWAVFLAGIALLFAAKGVYNLFYLKTVRWTITDEEVRVQEGILPWRKRSFGHPYETIFEAYYNFGFFAKLFGYGTIIIRRTEGNTTAESEGRMHDAAKMSGLINSKVKELRKAQRPAVVTPAAMAPSARSEVQELADLAKLKASGDISTEEFETLKSKIVGVTLALLFTVLLHGPVFAGINLEIVASPDPPRPNEMLDFEMTVTNDGAFDLDDVTLEFLFPVNIQQLANSAFDGSCPSTSCTAGELAIFDIPDLPAGKGITFSLPLEVASSVANGAVITFNAEVFDDSLSEATAGTSVTVDASREVELALVENRDPFAPGATQEYTMTYGVIATSPGSPGATLSLPVPAGTTFVSASDGGVLNTGTVEWALGNINPGSSGERRATFTANGGLAAGSIVTARATFADTVGNVVAHDSATRVQSEIPLRLQVEVSPDPPRPDEIMDVELTVTNGGFFDRTGVVVFLEIPDHVAQLFNSLFDGSCPSTSCTVGERALLDIGTLPAGKGRTFSMPFRVAPATVDGTVIVFEADVRDSTGDQRESGTTFATRSVRELELAMVTNRDPVLPGETIEYALTYGLIETSAGYPGAMLRLPLPAGTSFVSASDGGNFVGGAVEWSLGNLNAGATGERRARFAVDPGLDHGSIVEAEATYDGLDSREIRYEIATRIMDAIPVQLDVIASPDPARPGEIMDVELTVTNRGAFDRSDVELTLEFPDDIAQLFNSVFDGDCASTSCTSDERALFSIGTLAPGEGVSYTMPMQVAAAALDGTTIALEAQVTDSTGDFRESATVIAVDDTRNIDLSMSESDEPLTAGSTITYTMPFGTYLDGGGAPGTTMALELPAGTDFISASDGGVFANDVVSWSIGSLNPGAGGDRAVVVQIDPLVEPGTILEAAVRFDDASNPSEQVRFEESTRVANPPPFDVDLDIAQFFAPAGTTLDLEISVTNNSAFDRSGVVLRLEVPEGVAQLFNSAFAGSCPSTSCTPQETATIVVGPLAVGATASYPIPFAIAPAAVPGTVVNFDAQALDDTGFVSSDGDAVMVGVEFDGGRSAGAGGVSTGINGQPLRIAKAESCDDIVITWDDSCLTADDDYTIYAGTIGDFSTYAPLVCSTGGESSRQFLPQEGVSQFYLIVPQNGLVEGSYGRDDTGAERAPSANACLPQTIATTCE